MMKKALVFFGAFNPPTAAHIELAEVAMKLTERDEVIFVPSKSAYDQGDISEASFRMEMLNDLKLSRPWMTTCDYDITSDTQPSAYDILCRLKEDGVSPSLLIGSDMLFKMEHEWVNADQIAKEFWIVCLNRVEPERLDGILRENEFLFGLLPYITFVEVPQAYSLLSSTGARTQYDIALFHWKKLCDITPPEVSAHLLKSFMKEVVAHDS